MVKASPVPSKGRGVIPQELENMEEKSKQQTNVAPLPLEGLGEAPIYILGIESSCDDTSAAVLKNGVLLSNVTASQAVHESYGGVVPELASRAHQQNVVPVVHEAIKRAGI